MTHCRRPVLVRAGNPSGFDVRNFTRPLNTDLVCHLTADRPRFHFGRAEEGGKLGFQALFHVVDEIGALVEIPVPF